MKRKLQIFVSSTYRDLRPERQAAVEAILRAGHIPAGMELFAAGDRSQLETIYRWIDESDIYMLILGSRYGSVDPDSGKSYTQLEYEYALSQGKRLFAVVLTEEAIDRKVKSDGRAVLEGERPKELVEFRRIVTSKICRMIDDHKDIKLAIHETLLEFLREYSFDGWVSGKHLAGAEEMTRVIGRLTRENEDLRTQLQSMRTSKKAATESTVDVAELVNVLRNEHETFSPDGEEPIRRSVLDWFLACKSMFVTGISNKYDMSESESFLFFRVAPHLSVYGLTEDQKVSGVRWRTLRTTKKGNEFLAAIQKRLVAAKQSQKSSKSGDESSQTPSESSPPADATRSGEAALKKARTKVSRAKKKPS